MGGSCRLVSKALSRQCSTAAFDAEYPTETEFGDLSGQLALALINDDYTRLTHVCNPLRLTTMRRHSALLCHLVQDLEGGYLSSNYNVRNAYIALTLYAEQSAVVY